MPQGRLPVEFCRETILARQKQLTGQLRGNELVAQTRTGIHNLFFNVQDVDGKVYDARSGGWATDIPAIGLMEQYMVLSTKERKQNNFPIC